MDNLFHTYAKLSSLGYPFAGPDGQWQYPPHHGPLSPGTLHSSHSVMPTGGPGGAAAAAAILSTQAHLQMIHLQRVAAAAAASAPLQSSHKALMSPHQSPRSLAHPHTPSAASVGTPTLPLGMSQAVASFAEWEKLVGITQAAAFRHLSAITSAANSAKLVEKANPSYDIGLPMDCSIPLAPSKSAGFSIENSPMPSPAPVKKARISHSIDSILRQDSKNDLNSKQVSQSSSNRSNHHLSAYSKYRCPECGQAYGTLAGYAKHCSQHRRTSFSNMALGDPRDPRSAPVFPTATRQLALPGVLSSASGLSMATPPTMAFSSPQTAPAPLAAALSSIRGINLTSAPRGITMTTTPRGITMTATGKTFTCKHCTRIYPSLGALKTHLQSHALPCRCTLCGKQFSRRWLLEGHMRTHTGEKPFVCELCGSAFADRSNCRAHRETHREVKKFECTECSKSFARLALLTKHYITSHGSNNSA